MDLKQEFEQKFLVGIKLEEWQNYFEICKEELVELWEWIESKVSQVEKPVICSETKSLCEPKYTEKEILTAIRVELTKAFEEDSNPDDLQDKIYTTQGYVICALKNFASKSEPNGI